MWNRIDIDIEWEHFEKRMRKELNKYQKIPRNEETKNLRVYVWWETWRAWPPSPLSPIHHPLVPSFVSLSDPPSLPFSLYLYSVEPLFQMCKNDWSREAMGLWPRIRMKWSIWSGSCAKYIQALSVRLILGRSLFARYRVAWNTTCNVRLGISVKIGKEKLTKGMKTMEKINVKNSDNWKVRISDVFPIRTKNHPRNGIWRMIIGRLYYEFR